ncbi:MAG TPA: recombinase family protein, partial [Candidatus Woesebacteria bacterium]|nr:recombinase family protein [Candidatus Woesebacteria bacterium]
RPVFKELIADIMLGEFNAILTWHPDRLSRNAGDLGVLVDLMDQGKLKEIRTYSQAFYNTPNDKFLLMILCSQAKLENDNKGINVKRGIKAKCEMGWRPGVAPLGYMNRAYNGVKDIIIDPVRAPIIKEAFDKAAYYYYSGRQLKEFFDQKKFTTRNGKKIAISMIYLMLRNPFYYGYFEFPVGSNIWYKGSYEPLITKEVFDEVQKELNQATPPKIWGKKNFAYKGIFTCYKCGTSVCGEEKYRKRMDGTIRHHIYYHCTRSRNPKCREPAITERELVKQIKSHVEMLSEDVINQSLTSKLKNTLNQFSHIVKEINHYANDDYEYDGTVTLKDIVLYAAIKAPINIRKQLLIQLPIPKKLANGQIKSLLH